MEYYLAKGCLNCHYDECCLNDNEKDDLEKNGLPKGSDCIMWKNNHFRYKTLHKEKK